MTMDNGQWTMDNGVYDLLGRPVTSPQKPGIYIRNGKKYLLK